MINYAFTEKQLQEIKPIFDSEGPRDAYRAFHGLHIGNTIINNEVEDFACSFMAHYNRMNESIGLRREY